MNVRNIGDRVLDGTYEVHSRFERAVNLTCGDRLVSVVTESVGAGPINVVVDGRVLPFLGGLVVDGRAVLLGGRWHRLSDDRVYRSKLELRSVDAAAIRGRLPVLRHLIVSMSPSKSLAFLLDRRRLRDFRPGFERAVADRIARATETIFGGDLVGGVRAVCGCGFGLTPSGDDFVCGLLVGLNLVARARESDVSDRARLVFETARSGRALTDTFLSLARDGLVSESVKDLVRALGEGDDGFLTLRTERVLSTGATSGADFAVGFLMTVEHEIANRHREARTAMESHGEASVRGSDSAIAAGSI
jgi:hypothetical protein